MNALLLCVVALFGGDLHIEVRLVDGESVVDAEGAAIDPTVVLRQLAEGSERTLRGEDIFANAPPLSLHIQGRSLDFVLRALALATNTSVTADRHTITVSPPREQTQLGDLDLEAQASWLHLVHEFPDHEAARFARYQLGRVQERQGHDEAALAHYDAAVRTDVVSPSMDLALQASSNLLTRRGDWGEAQRRLSQLAVHATTDSLRASARLAIARALAMQGRGPESLALLDAVDFSYPARDDRETQDRRLVRARAHLAAGHAPEALRELDRRAGAHPAFGLTGEDLELRARALDASGAPLEASRAWLACASLANEREKQGALAEAARLASAGGDELAVLLIARLASGNARGELVQRMARQVRERLSLDSAPNDTLTSLESAWKQRAKLAPSERVALAARWVTAVSRERSLEEAVPFARAALAELDGADGSPVRAALASSYERRGLWSQAASTWNGSEL